MAKLMQFFGLIGALVVFIGTLPIIFISISGQTSTEAFAEAIRISMPFFIVGLSIIASAAAFSER
ncbi:hypothetical protein C9439_00890 [archaeon SCG-AAA382B04]|nr:hypothetical protein C9439_00890 [archaeon SCG-AAA382B04]